MSCHVQSQYTDIQIELLPFFRLGLKANEWYRIHATASRDTQRLTLQIGYPKNHNGPLLRNPPVDKNTGLTFVRESKFYTPNIIQPSRVKAVWLAAHPPPFMNVDRNTIWDFRGWMDDLVIANKVVSPSQVDDWLKGGWLGKMGFWLGR